MANLINFNPVVTSQPQSSFLLQTEGWVQGAFFDDPSTKNWLAGGFIGSSVTVPIWPGMAISESIPSVNSNQLGNEITVASSVATLSGFNVINRNYNAVITPGNNVQQLGPYMTCMYFRLGSNARIAVQCSSALVTDLEGGLTNQQVAWDFTNQLLIPYTTGTALPVKVLGFSSNSKIVSYNSGTGAVTWTTGDAAIIQI
jgi:hypothetical protein